MWGRGSVYSDMFPLYARGRYALNDIPPKRAAASKKKPFVWANDEAELLLVVTHDYKTNILWKVHVTIGRRRPPFSFKYLFSLFIQAFSLHPFSKSSLRFSDSEVSILGMHFHQFDVNRRLKRGEKYLFLTGNCSVD